jgi:3-oxoacyl-[acyl-carrier-protein] synthase-1
LRRIVIEQSETVTPLGSLSETTGDLIEGVQAIVPEPLFDVPVPFAPFPDTGLRDLSECASLLASPIDLSEINHASTIFIYCAAKGDIRAIEESVLSPGDTNAISPLLDKQADILCDILRLQPAEKLVISNACASGSVGVEIAAELLKTERYAHAVLFGFDCLSRFTANGFYALSALSVSGARPFDAGRNGLTMGEGAGIALLTYRTPYEGDIIVSGAGSSNDANHRTGPSRTGDGLFLAAQAAVADASLAPDTIGGVKCHGTATLYNDAMEAKALTLLFGENYPPCSSIKGAIGHLSGAGSLVEILIAAECIKRNMLPPTIGYANHGVDEPIPVSSKAQQLTVPRILCLAAGFGGLNSAVIVEEYE